MSPIRIVTDSTADIPLQLREELGITMVPLKVHFGADEYIDYVTLQPDEFYVLLAAADRLPTTSQPSPVQFVDTYRALLDEDQQTEIISLHLSAKFSGTYQSSVLAASMLEDDEQRVTPYDSKSATYGLGLLAVAAAKAARAGRSKAEILALLEQLRSNIGVYFLVDELEYLQKGGRIGKAAAMFGALLNIKPILTIDDDGEVAPIDKVRGQKKAMARIVELMKGKFAERPVQVAICHGHHPQLANDMAELAKQSLNVTELIFPAIGPVVGTHVGPKTAGIIVSDAV